MSSVDHPAYGDRRVDRREQPRAEDRRRTPSGSGRVARKGPCRECEAETDSVVIWNGKPVHLCPPCGARIRKGE